MGVVAKGGVRSFMRVLITVLPLLVGLATLSADTVPQFERDVEPLLNRYCFQCHGEKLQMGDLNLSGPSLMLKGGSKGPAVQKGSAEESLLYQRISDDQMPMGPKKLTDDQKRVIREWIDAGMPATTSEEVVSASSSKAEHWAYRAPQRPAIPNVRDAAWVRTPVDAFVLQKLGEKGIRPNAPADKITLLRRAYLVLIGLLPTPDEVKAFLADKSPDAIDRVIEQLLARPQYGERLARRWLDVARYAETNGYEEDLGKPSAWRYRDYVIDSFNQNKPFDRFLTEQIAGDEVEGSNAETQIGTTFLRLGTWDNEPADELLDRYDQLDDVLDGVASGFLGITIKCARCHDHKFEPFLQKDYYKLLATFEPLKRNAKGTSGNALDLDVRVGSEAELAAYDEAMEKVDKAIAPYNRLITNLQAGLLQQLLKGTDEAERAAGILNSFDTILAFRAMTAGKRRQRPPRGTQKGLIEAFEKEVEQRMLRYTTPEEAARYEEWNDKIAELEASRPEPPQRAYIWQEFENPPPTHVFHRGAPSGKILAMTGEIERGEGGSEVEAGVPAVLGALPPAEPWPADRPTSGRRLRLARWMTQPDNPLVARVFVNRLWQWTFGEGLVSSANDFGVMGQRPNNQKLLDFLATEFVRSGWNIKELQRLIVGSNTFALSTAWDDQAGKADPDGTLYWRWKAWRLDAEAVRDSTLQVSGLLNLEMHGPSIFPVVPDAVKAVSPGQSLRLWIESSAEQANRRGVYIFQKRGLRVPELDLMDLPDLAQSCEGRRVSTTGPQALMLLNSDFSSERAGHLAARLEQEAGQDSGAQVRRAFELALNRAPNSDEVDHALSFLSQQALQIESDAKAAGKPVAELFIVGRTPWQNARSLALRAFCLVLLNSNEFFYVN